VPYDWKKHFSHPGQIGVIRRRIRSLHTKANMYRKMGKMHLVADKKRQIQALRLYVQLLEMEEKKQKILKEIAEMGAIPGIEPYVGGAIDMVKAANTSTQ